MLPRAIRPVITQRIVLILALGMLPVPVAAQHSADHPELARLFTADQADRTPPPNPPRDFLVGLEARDSTRRTRVAELLAAGVPRTGADFHHAAMVMQHGTRAADYLRAHELATVAAALGHAPARWLMAASLDRFLLSIGRPQRFGTQSRFVEAERRYVMEPVEEGVTDDMRRVLDVPALQDAQARLAELNRQIQSRLRPKRQ